jgi:bacillithiol biosynthesis deacetylase BshB1
MDVLAIVAHPDDADIFCGGTLAKHADRGDSVTIAHMTRGEYGGVDTTQAELAEIREAEARASGDELGADVEFLGFEDGRITYSLDARLDLVATIREHAPDLIVTHFKDDMHPDHRATSRLVTDAYYMASLPLVDAEGEPCDPDNVYYVGKPTSSFEPTVHVDVSDYVDVKARAIEHHESQVAFLEEHGGIDAEFDDVVEGVLAEARTLGKQVGAQYAEGFQPLHQQARDFLR